MLVQGALLSFSLHPSYFGRLAIERGAHSNDEARGSLNVVLRFVVASFTAVGAIVLSVFGEAHAIIRVAKGAIAVALAAFFRLVADAAVKNLPYHRQVSLLAQAAIE